MEQENYYRRDIDRSELKRKAEDLLASIEQNAIEYESQVTEHNIKIIRQHLAQIALENGGMIPLSDAEKILNEFMQAKI